MLKQSAAAVPKEENVMVGVLIKGGRLGESEMNVKAARTFMV
jgi:hypothetical protein